MRFGDEPHPEPTEMPVAEFADVASLLAPKSVVVVGASDREDNLGGAAVRHLLKFGFPGDVWPVNPNHTSVAGLECFSSVAELPGLAKPSLGILAVPAQATIDLIAQCARVGIEYGVIWSGGFAELDESGAALQQNLVNVCEEYDFTVVGPNCLGVIDTHLPLTATFSSFLRQRDEIRPGNISMVSQSGGLATMVQVLADGAGFGFRYMVSSGNEAVVTLPDYIHTFVEDPGTKVIAVYAEGVREGDKLVASLREARDAGKPVVVLKAGLVEATARAAAAHTGAMVGEDRVWRAVLRELGVVQVDDLDEMLDVVAFLSSTDLDKLPGGPGVATVTFGGGMGVLSADGCARNGLTTPQFAKTTLHRLRDLVPPIASLNNPVDLTPQAYNEPWLSRLPEALEAMADDPGVDIVLAQFGTTPLDGFRMARAVTELRERTEKTVAFNWPFAPPGIPEFVAEEGMFLFTSYTRAPAALGRIVISRAVQTSTEQTAVNETKLSDLAWRAEPGGGVLSEYATHRLLESAGLAVPSARLVTSEDGAVTAARSMGLPVALKAISSEVSHRAANGLIALDVATHDDVARIYRELELRSQMMRVPLDGVCVQEMVPDGPELLLSAFTDSVFGVIVSVGTGGTLTEVADDVQLARAPLGRMAARKLILSLRLAQRGPLGGEDRALDHLAEYVAAFSALVSTAPWRHFTFEVNPLRWDGTRAVALDGLVMIEETV